MAMIYADADALQRLVELTEASPGEWFAFSTHASPVSARSRIAQLRNTRKYIDLGLEFRVAPVGSYKDGQPVVECRSPKPAGPDTKYAIFLSEMTQEEMIQLLDAITGELTAIELPARLVRRISA